MKSVSLSVSANGIFGTQQEKTQALLDEKTERWVYLNDLAEKIALQ